MDADNMQGMSMEQVKKLLVSEPKKQEESKDKKKFEDDLDLSVVADSITSD